MRGYRLTNFMRLRHHPSTHGREEAPIAASRHTDHGNLTEASAGRDSEIVEVGGVFVGTAARHALGYRFMAMEPSVLDMNESIWPTLNDLRRAVAQRRRAFLRTGNPLFPESQFPRSGTAPAADNAPGLIDTIRLTLNKFDW